MILLLDNYDSFTYNVYQLLAELGAEVEVIRHDQTTVDEIAAKHYAGIVISPGPGVPEEAGISEDVIRELGGRVPILGICLGHQLMALAQGGSTVKLSSPGMSGSVRPLSHFIKICPLSSTKSTSPSVPGRMG